MNTYQKRKKNGLCCRCGKELPMVNKTCCQNCLHKEKARSQKRQKKLLKQGLCKICGQNVLHTKNLCLSCSTKQNLQSIEIKRQRAKNKICTSCGKNKVELNKKMCRKCLDYFKLKRYNATSKFIQSGLCRYCGKNAPSKNKSICNDCSTYHKMRRKVLCGQSLCPKCMKPSKTNSNLCVNCSIKRNLRNRINTMVKRNQAKKHTSTLKLIGCSVQFLKRHLQKQFKEGMEWDNYGEWHIDHIKPLSLFDLTQEEEQRKACHYTNLQPLWAFDNLSKGNKYGDTNED